MDFDFKKYNRDFKNKSTAWHIKHYHEHNDEYRAIARKELLRRGELNLPWKRRVKSIPSKNRIDLNKPFWGI